MPTALAAILEHECNFRTVFHAHEVATIRRIVEDHPGHDTMFYNVLAAAEKDGRSLEATMQTPNGYDLTVDAGLTLAGHLLENDVEGGYYTPSLLMGAGFAERLDGVSFALQS